MNGMLQSSHLNAFKTLELLFYRAVCSLPYYVQQQKLALARHVDGECS